jgi:hypothetical protein
MFVKIERLLQIFSRRIPFFRAISNENSERGVSTSLP